MNTLSDELITIMKQVAQNKQSYRATAKIIGKSLRWVQLQIEALVEAGYIKRESPHARTKMPWILTIKGREVMDKHDRNL